MGMIRQAKMQQDKLRDEKKKLQQIDSVEDKLKREKEEQLQRYAKLMKGYTIEDLVESSLVQPEVGLGWKEKNKNRFLHNNFYTDKNVKPIDPFLRIPRNKVMPVIFTDQRAAIQLYHESTGDRREKKETKRLKQKDGDFVRNENYNSPRMVKLRKAKKKDGLEEFGKDKEGEPKTTEGPAPGDAARLKLMALNVDELAEGSSPKTTRSPGRKLTHLKPEVYKIVDTVSTRMALSHLQEIRDKKQRALKSDTEDQPEDGAAPSEINRSKSVRDSRLPADRAADVRKKYLQVDATKMLPSEFLKQRDSWIKSHKFGLPVADFPQ